MINPQCLTIKKKFKKSDSTCDQLIELFQLLANKARFRIVCMLMEGEFCVQEILETTDEGKISNISQHLKLLLLSKIVEKRRENKNIYYRLSNENVRDMFSYLHSKYGMGGIKS